MALATGGFQITKLTVSQILGLLPQEPTLLKEAFFKQEAFGHPLGIGWNKVEVFQSFCRYAELITSSVSSFGAAGNKLSRLGELVARYDPDLADLATWWFVHINLASNPDTNAYYAIFNKLPVVPLDKDEIQQELSHVLPDVSEATLKKDTPAILGWLKNSPLSYLGVLVTDGDTWMRRVPINQPHPLVVAYAAFHLQNRTVTNVSAVSANLSDLLVNRSASLKNIFNFSPEWLKTALRQASDLLGPQTLTISETAGIDTIYFGKREAWQIAELYYQSRIGAPK